MLMERPLAFAMTGISLAIMIPECNALMEKPNQVPGAALIVGAAIGAIGIYVGSSTARSYSKTLGRNIRLTLWGLLGLGMGIGIVYFGLRAPVHWQKVLFLAAGCLPFLAYIGAVFRGLRNPFKTGDSP